MAWLMVLGLLALNGFIASWNAYVVGRAWRFAGGFMTFVLWCALIQSVVGYSSIALVGILVGLHQYGKLDAEFMKYAMDLWYLLMVFPVIGSGLVIWLHGVIHTIRHPSVGGVLTSGWNTFANVHNIMGAVRHVPEAGEGVGKLLGSIGKSKDGAKALIVLIAVGVSIGIGITLTYVFFSWGYSATEEEMYAGKWYEDVGPQKEPPPRYDRYS